MIEVEIKLPIPEADNFKAKLLNLGFRESGYLQEHDTYFDNPEGSIRANGQALRVRVTKDPGTGKSSAQINFKGKKLDRVDGLGDFLEFEILVEREEEGDAG